MTMNVSFGSMIAVVFIVHCYIPNTCSLIGLYVINVLYVSVVAILD